MSTSTLLQAEAFGPAERLHAAIRRRYPQIAAALVRDEKSGLPYVSITYRDAGPKVVFWTGTTYRWQKAGGGDWEELHPDPDQTADAAAAQLGLPNPPADAVDEQP